MSTGDATLLALTLGGAVAVGIALAALVHELVRRKRLDEAGRSFESDLAAWRRETLAPRLYGTVVISAVGGQRLREEMRPRAFRVDGQRRRLEVAQKQLRSVVFSARALDVDVLGRMDEVAAHVSAVLGASRQIERVLKELGPLSDGEDQPIRGDDDHLHEAVNAARDLLAGLFDRADLRAANLNGVNLRGAVLTSADLSEADLGGADLRAADLTGATLTSASLSRTDLSDCSLDGASLRDANLDFASLHRASFEGADLRGAQLYSPGTASTSFRGAAMAGVMVRGALWLDLRGADLRGADLQNARLGTSDARGTDFRGADLSGADLSDLQVDASTDFRSAKLEGALLGRRFGVARSDS